METAFTRIDDGYKLGNITITDNGGGMGSARGSGRWALVNDGRWIANFDTLAEAKIAARELHAS